MRSSERQTMPRAKFFQQRNGQRGAFFRSRARCQARRPAQANFCVTAANASRARFNMCAEKVERFAEMDCSSPISASTRSKSGSSADCAVTGIPDCAANTTRPTVFSATVFPPVFGPLITRTVFVAAHFQRHRHNVAAIAPQRRFQNWMPRRVEFHLRACITRSRKNWQRAIELTRISSPRKKRIQLGNRIGRMSKRRNRVRAQHIANRSQNSRDFNRLIFSKLNQFIIEFNCG